VVEELIVRDATVLFLARSEVRRGAEYRFDLRRWPLRILLTLHEVLFPLYISCALFISKGLDLGITALYMFLTSRGWGGVGANSPVLAADWRTP
jgi:hypothetical protein